MAFDQIAEGVKRYFRDKLDAHGATPRGADWNSSQSQQVRFDQLLKLCDPSAPFSLIDYGCGYGGLYDYMTARGYPFHYVGYDLLGSAVAQARDIHAGRPHCTFVADEALLEPSDYVVASGIFNQRLDTRDDDWTQYVLDTLEAMNRLARRGLAFNMLTKYSDAEHMRPDLYYPDPCQIFDFCKRRFSRNVALLHDYELYDFTILVRK